MGFKTLLSLGTLLAIASWLGLSHWGEDSIVFSNTALLFWGTLWRTTLAGSLLAFALFVLRIPGYRLAMILLIAWTLVPLGLQTISWKSAWQQPGSWVDSLAWHGGGFSLTTDDSSQPSRRLSTSPQARMRGLPAVIWVHSACILPWATWIFALVFNSSMGAQDDQRRLESTGMWWWGHARRWAVGVGLLAMWVLVVSLNEIAASDIFYVRTYAEEIYLGFPLGDVPGVAPATLGAPAAMTERSAQLPLLGHLLPIGTTALLVFGLLWLATDTWSHLRLQPQGQRQRSPGDWVVSTLVWPGLLLGFLVPLGHVVGDLGRTAIREGEQIISIWDAQHALARWLEVIPQHRVEIGWSLAITSLAVIVTWSAAQLIVTLMRWGRTAQATGLILLAGLWSIPAPLIGVWLLNLSTSSPSRWLEAIANRSLAFPVISLTISLLPLATLFSIVFDRRAPRELHDLAHLESSSPIARYWRSRLRPLASWHLGLLALLAILGINDIAATNLVLPAGVDTLARRTLGLVHAGVDDEVAGAALWGYVLSLIAGSLWIWFAWRKKQTPPNQQHVVTMELLP